MYLKTFIVGGDLAPSSDYYEERSEYSGENNSDPTIWTNSHVIIII